VDIETDSDDDDDDEGDKEADLEILDQAHEEHVQVDQRQVEVEHVEATQTQARVGHVATPSTNVAGPSTDKPKKRKRSPKMKPKTTGDALVGVIDRFVNIKEKEVNNEAAQQYTINKCIAALRNLEGFDPSEKPKAFVVFKNVDNREIFLSSVEDNDGSALNWLRTEMANLP
jgi:septum formation topological specificity factor MinE